MAHDRYVVAGLFIGFSLLVVSAASIVAAMVTGWFAMCAAAGKPYEIYKSGS